MVVGCLIYGINTCIYLLKMSYMAHMSLLENSVADIDTKFGKKIQKKWKHSEGDSEGKGDSDDEGREKNDGKGEDEGEGKGNGDIA